MRALAWLILAGLAAVAGGFAIPLGFAFGLPAFETYIASVAGSVVGVATFLLVANHLWSSIEARLPDPPQPDSRLGQLIDRFGVRGLGLIGPIFPGVTATLLIGLGLRLDRRALLLWLSVGVALMFAVYVAVLAWLVDVVAVD